MKIYELLEIINNAQDIQTFANDNLLKLSYLGNRYILNYSEQALGTPKSWISHYCRGLTLLWVPNNYKIIAKSFDRFYNMNENPGYLVDHGSELFDFEKPFEVHMKYDGSIILEYEDNQGVHIQTRQSFANSPVNRTTYTDTYEKLFIDSQKIYNDGLFPLSEGETAVWELCSPHNHVVDYYDTAFSVLLGIVRVDWLEIKGAFSGQRYEVANLDEVSTLIKQLKPTQEWFVLAQWNDDLQKYIRVKCKTKTWVELSHFGESGEDDNGLWNVVFTWEIGEVLSVFPQLENRLLELNEIYQKTLIDVSNLYKSVEHIEDQKEFAMAVKDSKFNKIMFALRKWWDLRECVEKFLTK